MGKDVIYVGPRLKITFFIRGATLFSLAISPFKNTKLPNFANKTRKPHKKGREFRLHKNSSDDTKKWSPTAENWQILAKFELRSPAETVFTYRISLYFAKFIPKRRTESK